MRQEVIPVFGVCLGREFDIERLVRELPGKVVFTRWEEPVEVNVHGTKAYIFAFGSVVFFGRKSRAIKDFIEMLKAFVEKPREFWEEYAIIIGKKPKERVRKIVVNGEHVYVGEEGIYASKTWPELYKMVGFVVAQSAALRRMEADADEVAERIEGILEELMEKNLVFRLKGVKKALIDALRIRNALLNDLLILEKPSMVWEQEDYENLFSALRTVFDIDDRYTTVSKKLSTTVETAQLAMDIVSDLRFLTMEFLIVLFFFIEVIALFAGMW